MFRSQLATLTLLGFVSLGSTFSHAEAVKVLLGTPELTAGIPGEGPLTNAQITAWLDDQANHQIIDPELPLGLAAAAGNIAIPEGNPMTRAKIELGRQLYFDTRLSSDNTISCASCHHPNDGFGRKTRFGVGVDGQEGGRNSPVSFNRILSKEQFWDGRAATLEEQAGGPIANPIEMGNTHEKALATVKGIAGYVMQFDKIFPGEGVTVDTLTKAIATFERALVTGPAPYDYLAYKQQIEEAYGETPEDLAELKEEDAEVFTKYVAAKEATAGLSELAVQGHGLFFSEKSNCTACHAGANFSDEKYHNIGVGMDAAEPDKGRAEISKVAADTGAFKTPTVRNIAMSPPYMHDGSQKTLEEVVDWYAKGGHANSHLSDKMKKLELTEVEKKSLVKFMEEALASDFPVVEEGRLPQ